MSQIGPSRRASSIRADEIFEWYARVHLARSGTDVIRALDLAPSTYVRVDESAFWLTPGNSRRESRVTFSDRAPLLRRDSTQSQAHTQRAPSEISSDEGPLTAWQRFRLTIARWMCWLPGPR